MATNDQLVGLTPQQRDGIRYLHQGYPGDYVIVITRRPEDGYVVWQGAGRAAVIAPSGDFVNPEAEPGQAEVTVPYSEWATDLVRPEDN